ncbi:MAG: 5'/3'-nucleotidase SurE [Anaerolineales bacterium]|nr:5'/3'-nucleotidase SurE [Anaerolineales bacterium]
MKKPLIFLSNDDGIDSPGLHAAAAALDNLGELIIAAPLTQQSGMGRAWLTNSTGAINRQDLEIAGKTVTAYTVDGSPAQVVSRALLEVVPGKPDLMVSGINFGENPGQLITSSGTVGAAIEAAIHKIPSIAISLEMDMKYYHNQDDSIDFGIAGYFCNLFARRMLQTKLPADVDIIKIEVPCDATKETEWRITRLSRGRYLVPKPVQPGTIEKLSDVEYLIDAESTEKDSDIYTLAILRQISVTPLSLDLTSRTRLDKLSELLSNGFHPTST